MRVLFPVIVVCLAHATVAVAEDWTALGDEAIRQALTARVLAYPAGATQNFFADGRTLYEVPNGESWGRWWAEGGKYCSTWPPSDRPTCYEVFARDLSIRFVGPNGDEVIGGYIDLN